MRVFAAHSRQLLILGIALAMPACSLRLNDPVAQTQHSVSAGSGCLSQAGDVLDRFQSGALSEGENAAFFDCTHQALSTFLEYADGKNKEYFAPEELGGFLTKYFLQGKPIQPQLLKEAMALKTAVVGGSSEHLSRADLRRIMEALQNLRVLTDRLRPYMPITADSLLSRGYSGAEFEKVMTTFISAVADFGNSLKTEQGGYPFERLSGLVRELRSFLYPGNEKPAQWTETMLRVAAALPPAKQILIAPPRTEISPVDWPKIYRLAPRYYASMMRAQFYLKSPFNTFQSGGLNTVERLFSDFIQTFYYVIDQHPGQEITSEEIDDFVLTFADQQMLPCRPDTARQFIKVVFGRLFGGSIDGHKFTVTKSSLSRFQENVRFLLEGAHALEALYRPKFGDNFVSGTLQADEIRAVPDSRLLEATVMRSEVSKEAVAAVKASPFTVHTVFPGTSPIVVIPQRGLPERFSFMHLLKVHALHSLNRLLIQDYGKPGSNELSPAQIEAFVADVFPMLADLHVAGDSIKASVPKRLLEASLFLYASDGGQKLSMAEAIEMETLLLSTVLNAPRVHQLIAENCNVKASADGKVLIPAACYRQHFVANVEKIWNYLPGLVEYTRSLDAGGRGQLFDTMANFLHTGGLSGTFDISDTQSMLHFPYYVEVLFSRFDKNGDGRIDNTEAALAYPVFQPLIAEKAGAKGYNNPKDHLAIYNFLLSFRQLPTDDKWDYALRRYLLGDKQFADDRGEIVEIFEKLLSL